MVTRCVCCDISFIELLRRARAAQASTLDELRCSARFGEGCGLCLPYIVRVLHEGRTSFALGETASLDETATVSHEADER